MTVAPEDAVRGSRYVWLLLAVTGAVALGAAGVVAWMAVDPQFWFAGAYDPGPPGPRGPAGPRGASGPPGPEGPSASEAVDDLQTEVQRIDEDLTTLSEGSSSTELQGLVDQLQSDLDDVSSKLDEICSQFSFYEGAFADIYYSAC